jgi:hypothetical protein
MVLYCSRSGDRKDEKRARQKISIKNNWEKGTSKIGAVCPAHISKTTDANG